MIISEMTRQLVQVQQAEMRETAAKDSVARRFANVSKNNSRPSFFNWFRSQSSAPVQAASLEGQAC